MGERGGDACRCGGRALGDEGGGFTSTGGAGGGSGAAGVWASDGAGAKMVAPKSTSMVTWSMQAKGNRLWPIGLAGTRGLWPRPRPSARQGSNCAQPLGASAFKASKTAPERSAARAPQGQRMGDGTDEALGFHAKLRRIGGATRAGRTHAVTNGAAWQAGRHCTGADYGGQGIQICPRPFGQAGLVVGAGGVLLDGRADLENGRELALHFALADGVAAPSSSSTGGPVVLLKMLSGEMSWCKVLLSCSTRRASRIDHSSFAQPEAFRRRAAHVAARLFERHAPGTRASDHRPCCSPPKRNTFTSEGVVKARQQPCFVDERGQAGLEGGFIGGAYRQLLALLAPCQCRGHVFLDRYRALQGVVKARYTMPKPPTPNRPWISNSPRRVPLGGPRPVVGVQGRRRNQRSTLIPQRGGGKGCAAQRVAVL